MALTVTEFCVRTVSHAPETPGKHGGLREYVDAYRCCEKSLIGSALVGCDVRQHARAESISKRDPSTTRTSLRLFTLFTSDQQQYEKHDCVRAVHQVHSRTPILLRFRARLPRLRREGGGESVADGGLKVSLARLLLGLWDSTCRSYRARIGQSQKTRNAAIRSSVIEP